MPYFVGLDLYTVYLHKRTPVLDGNPARPHDPLVSIITQHGN